MFKNAQYDLSRKALYFIIVIFFLAVMFIILNSAFRTLDVRILTTSQSMAQKVLMNEALYSPLCFAYVDKDTGRAHPGIIDASKFNSANLYTSCGRYFKDRFVVYLARGEQKNNIKYLTYPAYVKKASLPKVGKEDAAYNNYMARPVIIYDNGKFERGALVVAYAQ
ncbi:MAG: hypothetical protein AABY09_04625 [Nanoarchaeota archaeon]